MKYIRATLRILYLPIALFYYVSKIVVRSWFKGKDVQYGFEVRRQFVTHMLPVSGMKAHFFGKKPDFPCIIMCNHRTYFDPAVLAIDIQGYAVSKAEVEHWPLFGKGAEVSGVIFLKRENKESRSRTLTGILDKWKEGYHVYLFPEGTTKGEPTTVTFHRGGFKLAAEHNIPILPIAMEYSDPDAYWVGKDKFVPHIFKQFMKKRIEVWITYGTVQRGNDADKLLADTQAWIDGQLLEYKDKRGVRSEE